MEPQARRKYDRQFKREAIRLVAEGGRKATEVARDLGIEVNLLYRWKQQCLDHGDGAFPGKGKLKPQDEELHKVKRELEQVTEERDILKKALAVFSRASR